MPTTRWEPARGQRVPVEIWSRAPSEECVRQLVRLACRPYVVERVCGMADAHVAEGVSVGTVFATRNEVVPRALGGDLGCGVLAIELSVSDLDRPSLERAMRDLLRAIPAGDALHRSPVAAPDHLFEDPLSTSTLERTRAALVKKHLGTLGGGNHFLEIDRDASGQAWLLVHSGSRGLGGAIAAHHVRAAESADSDPLAALSADTAEGAAYLADHAWALAFARENRMALARRAIEIASEALGVEIEAVRSIDTHHNFVVRESGLLVHRKGAVSIPRGDLGIVPGSMATATYIVEGLGNPLAFDSCSHGAGRVLTRREAHRAVSRSAFERSMRRIVWPAHLAARLVEESPQVYRDVVEVLEDQEDLVRRRLRLEPVLVLKG